MNVLLLLLLLLTMVYRSSDILTRLQKFGDAASEVLCVCLVTASCEGSRKVGKGATHVQDIVARVVGRRVRTETEEVKVADSGREEKSLGFGQIIQDFQRIVCHSMEFVLPC